MLDCEDAVGDEIPEAVMPPPEARAGSCGGGTANLEARRRIERIRELIRLRELLDDPDFDDLT